MQTTSDPRVACPKCKTELDAELGEAVAGEPGVRSFRCPTCRKTFGLYSSVWLNLKGGGRR